MQEQNNPVALVTMYVFAKEGMDPLDMSSTLTAYGDYIHSLIITRSIHSNQHIYHQTLVADNSYRLHWNLFRV